MSAQPKPNLISEDNDWTFEHIEQFDREIARIAKSYELDTYPNQIEVIRSDQMLDAYSSVCLLYTSPSPRDATLSRMPSSA